MIDAEWPIHLRFFLALALSFLIGLERESAALITKGRVFAGVRTYTLIGMLGFGCAWLVKVDLAWVLPVGMIVLGALALVGYLAKLREGHVGWTSEVAAILAFVMGALCLLADLWVPTAIGIVTTMLLSEKAKLEKFVEALDQTEFHAVVRFLIVTLIILPILPNQSYTDFNLNPRHIWTVVILVSAIGFGGYFLSKRFGERWGLWVSGLLGGIVSSTAVSIAAGRIAQQTPERANNALQASLIASAVMYLRILVLIWVLRPDFVVHFWARLVLLGAIGGLLCLTIPSHKGAGNNTHVKPSQNPFEIRPALIFATLFVVLSVLTVLVKKFYGEAGILVLSGVVGLTDIDPFILSFVSGSSAFAAMTLTAIIVSMMSNTIIKGVYFGFLAKEARVATAWRYGLWALLHIPVILLWR